MEGLVAIWYDGEQKCLSMLRASLGQHPRHAMLVDELIAQVLHGYMGWDQEALHVVVNTAALYAAIGNALPPMMGGDRDRGGEDEHLSSNVVG